jgi:hypothetical protein
MASLREIVGVLLAFGLHGAHASDKVPQCPVSYPLEGVSLTKVPAGWIGRFDARLDLQAASVVEIEPTNGAMRPEVVEKKNGDSTATYTGFNDDPKVDAWLACHYGYEQEVKLVQKLPPGVHTCTMHYKYDRRFRMASLDHYTCK